MRESMASVYVNNPAAAIVSPMQSKGSLNELTSEGWNICTVYSVCFMAAEDGTATFNLNTDCSFREWGSFLFFSLLLICSVTFTSLTFISEKLNLGAAQLQGMVRTFTPPCLSLLPALYFLALVCHRYFLLSQSFPQFPFFFFFFLSPHARSSDLQCPECYRWACLWHFMEDWAMSYTLRQRLLDRTRMEGITNCSHCDCFTNAAASTDCETCSQWQ